MATAIRKAIAALPKDGVMAGAFKQSIKQSEVLLRQLDKLAAKGGPSTQRQDLGVKGRAKSFEATLGANTKEALYKKEVEALNKLTFAEKQAFVESNKSNKEKARISAEANRQIRAELKATADAEEAKARAILEQRKVLQQQTNSLITMRYALYDVGSTLQSASQALLNYTKTLMGAAIAQESAFSKIEKTQIGVNPAIVAKLKKELLDLTTQIPKTFEEITSIGMLGAQLGIAAKDIASFTKVVAQFSTITGVSVEETALAFGKLASLLNVPTDKFEALGASIAAVGNAGASTEQQILSTAKQIAAVSTAAGLSTSEVVGLASAMASLGIAPEEARGVIIPTFQEMNRAVLSFSETTKTGNESLKLFSQVAGVSAEEFARLWSDKESGGAGQIFQKFLKGLGQTDTAAALDKLNLAGIRTSKGLTALGKDYDTLAKQIDIANKGFEDSTFLDASFAKTVEDVASKIKMMQSAIENLFASMAGGNVALSGFGIILDIITLVAKGLTDLANSSRIAPFIMTAVTALLGFGGVLLAIIANLAIAVGGMLALRVAAINAITPGASNSLAIFMLRLSGLKGEALKAAVAIKSTEAASKMATTGLYTFAGAAGVAKTALRGLMSATVVGVAITAVGFLLEGLLNLIDPIKEVDQSTESSNKTLGDLADESENSAAAIDELRSAVEKLIGELKAPADLFADMQEALFDLGKSLRENGKDFSAYSEGGRANLDALSQTVDAIVKQGAGDVDVIYTNILALMKTMEAQGYLTADSAKYLSDILGGLTTQISTTTFTAPNIAGFDPSSITKGFTSIKTSAGSAKSAVDVLGDSIDKAFKKLDRRIALQDSLASLKQSLLENGSAFSNFSESGRSNINALRDTIDALATESNGNKRVFVSNLNALKIALIQSGMAGPRAIALINKAIKETGVNAKASAKQVKEFKRSIDALKADRVIALANAMQNLSDKVMNYLNARWMLGNVQMEIAAGWEQISQSADQAAGSVEDVSDQLNQIAANKEILQYQLEVALKYGDTLRANELRAEIAALDAERQRIQDEANRAAQEAASQPATPAQDLLAQQQALQNMVGYYVQMGSAEVIGAKTKKEAKKAVQETVEAFRQQALAAGVSEENVNKYAKELEKGLNLARELNKPVKYKVNAATKAALDEIRRFRDQANAAINAIKTTVTVTVKTVPAKAAGGLITKTPAYASGGFVRGPGTETSDSILARVSNGEFVMRASAVKAYGLDFMNSLNNATLVNRNPNASFGGQSGIMGEQVIYLSPEDRQLLRAAIDRPINLYTDNARIAQSANAGNVVLAQRGSK
nr:MAG TPA: tail tape measure [Caudoviricetes sp.]